MATVSSDTPAAGELRIIKDATCTFCGCLCDDIDLSVQCNRIVEAQRACELGEAWFLSHAIEDRPSCLIEGQPASVEEGCQRAAEILTSGKSPIVFGLSDSPCETQRVAVSIADWINGTIDTTTSDRSGSSMMAFQSVGEVTCTLGEVANRGDFIMFWGSDPAESHPRHFARYSLMPKGMFTPNGRKDRTCVVVDVQKTKTSDAADIFLQIEPQGDFEALWILRALARGVELDAAQVERVTGIELAVWQDLMGRMKAAKFGVIFFGTGLTKTRGKHANAEALFALTRDMNAHTKFVARENCGPGNVTGANNVLTWRTGYPFGVNHNRGYPRFNPGEYTTSDALARGEADCGMMVVCDLMTNFSQPAREHLASIPYIALDTKETATTRGAAVAFMVATYGIHTSGTVYRMDGVSLPLRPAFESPHPSDFDVLMAIEARVKKIVGVEG